ncbi:tissue factor pathway inhibitor a [Notolabrus celidotus]|uniref:tissue factor pathway inhibitor a n=1 Tax=Notolabrus celidotus TaxID=1203425 RepID=UPI00148FED01|nr:tissue factor pathway inhibitor a [Notolabrus celidotus]
MALSNKWWILCAVSLSCVASFGSCRTHVEDGAPAELHIFNELCAMKDEPGPCKAIKERFFFNVDTGHCELFEYGGCGGNANNFETLEACEESCVVSDDKNPCHLPEAPGPCRGLATRYLFDTKTQMCKTFFYGGCFGNANNFRSMAECQAKCQNPVKTTKAPEVQSHSARRAFEVQPTIVAGEMLASEPQVQLSDAKQEIQVEMLANEPQVQMNGTKQEIKDLKPTDPCSRPLERGNCDSPEKRFGYNPDTRRCHMFRYSGCGGNENNFRSRRECSVKCARRRKTHGRKMIRIRKKNLDIIQRSV